MRWRLSLALHDEFFRELDRHWPHPVTEKITLSIIGSGALMLQTRYERGTRDSDVFETAALTKSVASDLLALAGKGTPLALRRGMHIDIVANGIPFLPRGPRWHPMPSIALEHFEIHALDVIDVVVSKLKRFNANDISDADAMIGMGHVDHGRLLERFRSAFDEFSHDSRAADLGTYVSNLNRVERDMFGVAETEFDLASIRY
jgi:hypothetical protein